MGVKVRNFLKRQDGTPWPRSGVLLRVVDRIQAASKDGKALRLTAEEVRALDWSIIRESIQCDDSRFRDASFAELNEEPTP